MEYQLFAIDDGLCTVIVRASQEAMLEARATESDDVEVESRYYDHDEGQFCWRPYGVIDYTIARPLAAPPPAFVNAYSVTRHYGGPEEGGWWYDRGTPLASVPVPDGEPVAPHVARLEAMFEDETCGDLNSVRGGSRLQISVELTFAQPWPASRPHYE